MFVGGLASNGPSALFHLFFRVCCFLFKCRSRSLASFEWCYAAGSMSLHGGIKDVPLCVNCVIFGVYKNYTLHIIIHKCFCG